MKVLVTGATGFVGQHVVLELLERGHNVVAVARDEAKARGFKWFESVNFIACDIHCPVTNLFEKFGQPEAVMHLAWSGLPNYNALFHFEDNLPAHYQFLKTLVMGGAKHLLITGTCLEYGALSGCLVEDMKTHPTNSYALAKDTLRKFMEELKNKNTFTLQWARLFYMFGTGQNPNSLLAQLDIAIDNDQPVFNMSFGEQLRDYLPVELVASGLVALLEQPNYNGTVNICSGKPISVRRLVELHKVKRKSDIQLNLGCFPHHEYEPFAFWGSRKRLDELIGERS